MSEVSEAVEVSTMKVVDEQVLVGAKVEQVDFGLPATKRCTICDAQAYVEIEVYDKGEPSKYADDVIELVTTEPQKRHFEMCAHHFQEHEIPLSLQAVRIIDHRPFLRIQENLYRGQLASQ